jgi:hypothetical protein
LKKYCSNTRGYGWCLCVPAERWYCLSAYRCYRWCVCVCQHTDGTGDVSVGLSACRWYWWWLYVCQHTEGIGGASVYLSAWRWGSWCLYLSADGGYSWCLYLFISIQMILVLPASVYEQSTADSFGRYITHLIFGNSDRGRLLILMFSTKELGTIDYQLLISSTKNWTHIPSETGELILYASCFAISKGVLKGTSVLFQTWVKYSAKHRPELLVFKVNLPAASLLRRPLLTHWCKWLKARLSRYWRHFVALAKQLVCLVEGCWCEGVRLWIFDSGRKKPKRIEIPLRDCLGVVDVTVLPYEIVRGAECWTVTSESPVTHFWRRSGNSSTNRLSKLQEIQICAI